LANHETLVRQDFNDENAAAEYRQEFADTVGFIASHFKGRITVWIGGLACTEGIKSHRRRYGALILLTL